MTEPGPAEAQAPATEPLSTSQGLDLRQVALVCVVAGAVAKFGFGRSWGLMAGLVFGAGFLLSDIREWNQFWFSPVSRIKMATWRVALGVLVLAWGLSLTQNVERFFGSRSLLPDPEYLPNFRFGLMRWWDTPTAAWVIWSTLIAAAILIIAGRALRPATVLAWYALSSLHQANPFILNSADDMVRLLAFLLMVYVWLAPPGSTLSPAAFVRQASPGAENKSDVQQFRSGSSGVAASPAWLMRLVQFQLSVIYPASFLGKIGGASWRDGTAATLALQLQDFARFPVPDFIRETVAIGSALTWAALLLEFALAALLWFPGTRRFGIVAGMAMHVGFAWAMSLGFFTPVLLVAYLSFVDEAVFERWANKLARL